MAFVANDLKNLSKTSLEEQIKSYWHAFACASTGTAALWATPMIARAETRTKESFIVILR